MARKRIVVTLPADAYKRLTDLAALDERVIDQQASYLLKRLLLDENRAASLSRERGGGAPL